MTSDQRAESDSAIPPVSSRELATAALPGSSMDPGSHSLLKSELERLRQRRLAHDLPPPVPDNLTALALSGGGIRSATFSLGVLQALAKYDLLKHFDFLSTVSGGGYIGSSLTWWLSDKWRAEDGPHKGPAFGVGKRDFPYGTDNPAIWRGQLGTSRGAKLLSNLRKHGNYLTPGGGIRLLSGLAVVLRAVLLNLLVWLPLSTLAMLLILGALDLLFEGPPPSDVEAAPLSRSTFKLLVVDGILVASFLTALAATYFFALRSRYSAASGQIQLTAATDATMSLRERVMATLIEGRLWGAWTVILGTLVILLLLLLPPEPRDYWHGLRLLLAAAGILSITFLLVSMIYSWATRLRSPGMRRFSYQMRRMFETWAAVYLPLIIALALIGVIPDAAEWLADPEGIPLAPESGAGGGIFALLAGMIAAGAAFLRSGARVTGMLRERGFKVSGGFTAALAAALLLFGILLITHDFAGRVLDGGALIWTIFAVTILLVLVSAIAVNINHISLGRFYRDRLMEAFMPGYDAALACRTGAAPPAADEMKLHESSPSAPYHIINTNVVLVNAKDRRRHIRGGDNFILTSDWCGSNATGWCRTRIFMNDGMTLATAMAISGAAANPNTGVGGVGLTRSRTVSVLMALLNLRLGYWVPHPGPGRAPDKTWGLAPWAKQSLTPNHFRPGFSSLFFGHREDARFQELTDGGHFENLGIYELIRRRVRLILVCDGGQDPDFGFEDLQTALRRIGEDFGAKIRFLDEQRMEDMMSWPAERGYPRDLKLAKRGFAVARIDYPPDFDEYGGLKPDDQRIESTLIYLNTTMIDGLPLELRGYVGKNPDFPDQPTSDQFFDEDQFEAYRELGYRIAKSMIEEFGLGALLTKLQPPLGDAARVAPPAVPEQHREIAAE